MVELFTRGTWDARAYVDQLIAEFIRLKVVKPMLAEIFGGTGGGGFLAFLGFGGAGAASTGAELSGAAGMPVGTFASGIDYVPHDMPAFIHKGERVVTAAENARGAMGRGNVVTVNHYNTFGQGVSPSQLAMALDQNRQQTKAEISDQVRRGSRAFH